MKKEENYKWALRQIQMQIKKHFEIVSTLANITAILKERFINFYWVGFYFLKNEQLVLGPFQGPPACMKLNLENGVCATAIKKRQTIIVPDVHLFNGHIACDKRSNSEIVIPCFNLKGDLKAVLDIDSEKLNNFNQVDKKYLEIIGEKIRPILVK